MRETSRLSGVRGVIFDMDGTLTVSPLDFDRIRSECGAPQGGPILEWMQTVPEPQRRRALDVLLWHERRAAERCTLRDGVHEVMSELARRGFRTALLTRSSTESVETVLKRFGLQFDCCVTREDALPKPSPEPVLKIAAALGLKPGEMLMVGDYIFDVQAGHAAGTRTAFVKTGEAVEPPEGTDLIVGDLRQLLGALTLTAPGR